MKRLIRALAILLSSICLSDYSFAQDAESYFRLGMSAFQSTSYENALQYFQQAQALGMTNKRLPYNMGVTYYKLGQYAQAYEMLEQATQDKDLAALAYINRALCAQKLHKNTDAVTNVKLAYSAVRTEQEKAFVKRLMKKLGVAPGKSKSKLATSLLLDLGYNDNVTLTAIDDTGKQTNQSDNFLRYFAKLKFGLSERITTAGNIYGLKYQDLNVYDYNDLGIDVVYTETFDSVEVDLSASFNKSYLDSSGILEATNGVIGARYYYNSETSFYVRFTKSTIRNTSDQFDYLGGDRNKISIGARLLRGSAPIRFDYGYETNERNNVNVAGAYEDFSPTRHKVSLTNQIFLTKNTLFELSAIYRESDYDSANQLSESRFVVREDERLTAGLRLLYKLANNAWVIMSYQLLDNHSNIEKYNYHANQYMVGVTLQ